MKSINDGGEKELLDDWHNLDLTEVKEELVKLLLVSAVQNEVGSEDKDTSRKGRQDFQSLKANNPVQEHVHIVNFRLPTGSNRSTGRLWEGVDNKLVHMETDLWLVHLKQIFKELAKEDNGLGVILYRLKLAEILAVHRPEYEEHYYLLSSF